LVGEDSVRPGSPLDLTRKRYAGPFLINHVVKGHDDIGIAYELIVLMYNNNNNETRKLTRDFVSNDRLEAELFTQTLSRLDRAKNEQDNKSS